ncbi:hypothetical protein CPB85DRAFT_1021078 [Mucidula mucida]|nr:hypothetical protein CPB85DRAFT_1021078 [Mucidula mucida]
MFSTDVDARALCGWTLHGAMIGTRSLAKLNVILIVRRVAFTNWTSTVQVAVKIFIFLLFVSNGCQYLASEDWLQERHIVVMPLLLIYIVKVKRGVVGVVIGVRLFPVMPRICATRCNRVRARGGGHVDRGVEANCGT